MEQNSTKSMANNLFPDSSRWQIVDREPESGSVTVEVKFDTFSCEVKLKGVPSSSAYFLSKKAIACE